MRSCSTLGRRGRETHTTGVKGPSAIEAKGNQLSMYRGSGPFARPMELTLAEIAEIRRAFVDSALRARAAGFDGVELHGANGYLLDAFHTDYQNVRDDEYYANAAAFPDEDQRSLAELARTFAPGVTVIANGHIDTGEEAQQLLTSDHADLVAIGRAALTNRDWPRRVKDKLPLEHPFNTEHFGDLAVIQDWEIEANSLLGTTSVATGATS